MQYVQSFRYIIDRNGGYTNLLLLTVCQLIPVLGPIVLLGYQAEVAVALSRDPDLRRHPKFSFDYFMDYLNRGVWPFLMQIVLSLIMFIPLGIGVVVAFLAVGLPVQGQNPPIVMLSIVGGVFFIAMIAFSLFSVPMTFHAEFTGKFDLRGAFRFAKDFLALVGGKAIVTGFAHFFLTWVVLILGLLCCCVGIYPASTISQMAIPHLMVQLYGEYLDRGGEELEEFDPWDRERERDRRRRDDVDREDEPL